MKQLAKQIKYKLPTGINTKQAQDKTVRPSNATVGPTSFRLNSTTALAVPTPPEKVGAESSSSYTVTGKDTVTFSLLAPGPATMHAAFSRYFSRSSRSRAQQVFTFRQSASQQKGRLSPVTKQKGVLCDHWVGDGAWPPFLMVLPRVDGNGCLSLSGLCGDGTQYSKCRLCEVCAAYCFVPGAFIHADKVRSLCRGLEGGMPRRAEDRQRASSRYDLIHNVSLFFFFF